MVKAVIFDMDCVIIDSEPVYLEWLRRFLKERQVAVSEEELMGMVGISSQNYQKNLEHWWRRSGKRLPQGETLYQMFDRYTAKQDFSPNELKNPHVTPLFEELKARGIRIALASSSSMDDIRKIVTGTGLFPYLDLIVSGADFAESKPNPEIYLHTMDRLGVGRESCIAVEDSEYGIQAAKGAGIFVVAKKEERFGFSQKEADAQIEDLDQLLGILEVLP